MILTIRIFPYPNYKKVKVFLISRSTIFCRFISLSDYKCPRIVVLHFTTLMYAFLGVIKNALSGVFAGVENYVVLGGAKGILSGHYFLFMREILN